MNKMKDPTVKDVLKEIHIDEYHNFNPQQRQEIDNLLEHHRDIFSTADDAIGYCDKIKHMIDFCQDVRPPLNNDIDEYPLI